MTSQTLTGYPSDVKLPGWLTGCRGNARGEHPVPIVTPECYRAHNPPESHKWGKYFSIFQLRFRACKC